MSLTRWALSAFFVWHVIAITLGSLESPGTVLPVGPPRHPTNNAISATVTPLLDEVASGVSTIPGRILHLAGPIRVLAARYRQVTGVSQSWKMFSGPPTFDQYLRIRYYIGARSLERSLASRPVWTATELVLPAHREDEIRLVRGFWDSYLDKAVTIALGRFLRNRGDRLLSPDAKSSELPKDFAPIARYFARRYQQQALQPDERILRTEIWYGRAPMPLPGESLASAQVEARLAVLAEYYQGAVEDHLGTVAYPAYLSIRDEADIGWRLEYFEP